MHNMEHDLTPIAIIINGQAGSGHKQALADALRERFAACALKADVTLAENGAQLIDAARAALAAGMGIVVAGGGDGSLNAVASVLVDTDVAFGVLPLGTLNHFARDLGIPFELDAAIAIIAGGRRIRVDVGEVNGRIFLNNSGLGLYPDMVRDRQRQRQRLGRGKWMAACWAAIAALRRYPFLSLRIKIDQTEHARRTPFVFIGNNEFTMAGWAMGARSRIDGGTLSLYVAQHPGRLGLLRLAWRALWGRLGQGRELDILLAHSLEISTHHKRLRVATDGEVTLMATPLHYRIRPAALSVIVPT
jgi:diacylglycerol kinase family enzyme